MILEQATVVEVNNGAIVVETLQQSTCGSCVAQKGCGQGVLAKYLSSSSFFRVDLGSENNQEFRLGDVVELGIDEFAIVRASVWLYLVPLLGLLFGGYLGSLFSEIISIIFALTGLALGGFLSSRHAEKVKNLPEYAPVLVTDIANIRIVRSANPA